MIRIDDEPLTADELEIISILETDAKASIDVIGKKCGFSRQKVWKIIKKLEEKKIIWGYSAITGTEVKKTIVEHFTLLLKRSMLPLDEAMKKEVIFEKLDDYLPAGVKIENIIITHGEWDAIITFYAPNLVSAIKAVDVLFERLGKYFQGHLLLEHLFPIRKNGFKNPQIKNLVDYI